MAALSNEKEVVVTGARSAAAGDATLMRLRTDKEGWPLVQFEPADPMFDVVADFLASDVGVFLPSCDLLIAHIKRVLADQESGWYWNGNGFIVEVARSSARLVDKYGQALGSPRSATVPTPGLLQIIQTWRDFVAESPRQAEFKQP